MKKRNENILMIVIAFTAFSTGIWSNYRQLWLEEAGYSITGISKILSVALICSSITAFIVSIFSSKIKVKSILILSYIFKSISLIILLFLRDNYIIKACMLMSIMCDVILAISLYPLLSFESRSNRAYKRKMLIEYFFKDIGIILCGLLLGVSLGKYVFNYNTCLLITIITTIIPCIILFMFKSTEDKIKRPPSLLESTKSIFSSKINRVFLFNQIICYMAYGVVFDLMMLILTNYVGFSVSYASIFIIISNALGTVFSYIFSKISKNYSVALSAFIKYGTRAIIYIIAFKINTSFMFVFTLVYAFIMCRVLEDKTTGTFVEQIDEKNQFLYENMRYLALCLGEGSGAYLAGVFLEISFRSLFLGAALITIIQTIIFFYLSKLNKEKNVDFNKKI